MSEKLLPCPFCGGEALIGQTLDNAWYAMCIHDHCCKLESYWRTAAEAIAAWNTRAAMQADAAPVATSDRRDAITAAKDVLAGRGNGTYDEALDAIRWLLQSAGIHDAPVADRVSTPKPVDDRGSAKTSDKLRPAVDVWWQAETAFEAAYTGDGDQAQRAATAIIEADRQATRAALVAEIVAWMRGNCMSGKWRVLASEIEEKWSNPE